MEGFRVVDCGWGRGCLAIIFYTATVCPCHIEYYYYYYCSVAGGPSILLLCVRVVQLKTSLNTPGYKFQTFYCAWNPGFIIFYFTSRILLFHDDLSNGLNRVQYTFHQFTCTRQLDQPLQLWSWNEYDV